MKEKNKNSDLKETAEVDVEAPTLEEEDQPEIEPLVVLQKENQDLKDQLLRFAAEFDNFKKRSERDRISMIEFSSLELFRKILPVLDDLERSLQASDETREDESLFKGIEMVYNNFIKILSDLGLEPMKSVGTDFDPEHHEAMMQIAKEGVEPQIVLEEPLKGYVYNDRVVRHAKVVVSS